MRPRKWSISRRVSARDSRLYDVVGYNCEHAANFCATGWPESYQVRSYFAVRAIAEGLLTPFLVRRFQASARWRLAAVVFSMFGIATVLYSWRVSKRFWERVGLEWRAYEAGRSASSQARP